MLCRDIVVAVLLRSDSVIEYKGCVLCNVTVSAVCFSASSALRERAVAMAAAADGCTIVSSVGGGGGREGLSEHCDH